MIFKIYLKGTHENKFKGILSIAVVELPLIRSQSSTEWNGREKAKKKKEITIHHLWTMNFTFPSAGGLLISSLGPWCKLLKKQNKTLNVDFMLSLQETLKINFPKGQQWENGTAMATPIRWTQFCFFLSLYKLPLVKLHAIIRQWKHDVSMVKTPTFLDVNCFSYIFNIMVYF